MNKIFLSIIITIFIFSNLKANILSIHKRIVPVCLLQIEDIVNKTDKEINLVLVVNKKQISKAIEFKDLLPNKIKLFSLNTKILYDTDIKNYLNDNKNHIDAFYYFDIEKSLYRLLNNYTKKNHIVTFGYDYENLKTGALIYIDIKNKIDIYLNKKLFINNKINFNNQFLQIVEIYDK